MPDLDVPAVVAAPTYLFRCTLERLGEAPRLVDMGDGNTIEFSRRANGQHMALVQNPAHVKRLMAITEAYEAVGIVAAEPAPIMGAAPVSAPVEPEPTVLQEPGAPSTLTPDAARAALVQEDATDEANHEAQVSAGSLTIEEARALYETTLGRRPHPSASLETLVARINEHRAETDPT